MVIFKIRASNRSHFSNFVAALHFRTGRDGDPMLQEFVPVWDRRRDRRGPGHLPDDEQDEIVLPSL